MSELATSPGIMVNGGPGNVLYLDLNDKYIGTKTMHACPMTRGEYNDFRGWTPPAGEDQSVAGHLVRYEDGYISWTPADVFAASYRKTDKLNFGLALEALKQGKKICRSGWNGKNMFLFYLPPGTIPKAVIHDGALKSVVQQVEGDFFEALGSVRMWTADKKVLTGWLASQTDMLADDWMIIE